MSNSNPVSFLSDFSLFPQDHLAFEVLKNEHNMTGAEYKPVPSGSDGHSRDASIELKGNENYDVDIDDNGICGWKRLYSRMRRLRGKSMVIRFKPSATSTT